MLSSRYTYSPGTVVSDEPPKNAGEVYGSYHSYQRHEKGDERARDGSSQLGGRKQDSAVFPQSAY